MGAESKVEYLIVDTSAFIKNAALQDIGNKIITEPTVVSEIKSKRQLKRLVVLPYDLEVKEAFPEDIKFVTEFAKKTGDYISLSSTDIKVIALTYRYEREKVGVSHLRTEPETKKEIVDTSVASPDQVANLVGFYMPDGNDDEESDSEESTDGKNEDRKEDEVVEVKDKADGNIQLTTRNENANCPSLENKEPLPCSESNSESDSESEYDSAVSDDENSEINDLNKKFEKINVNPAELEVECGDNITIDDILKPVSNKINKEDEEVHDSGSQATDDDDEEEDEDNVIEDGDDNGWITPKNIKNVKKQMDSAVVKEKPATVACLTMDYAMQNVLMQIGLNIASLEGKVIKEMRTFILRCYACFKTTGIVTKVFCPHCGNKTLKKVAVSIDDEGKQQIHINFRKPLSAKGKKYSLPTFQGGKHARNPILFEDQPLPHERPTKLGRVKNDPLKDEYIAGYSPFVTRDVNSRAAMLGVNNGTMKYWMRKNPNEAKRHRK